MRISLFLSILFLMPALVPAQNFKMETAAALVLPAEGQFVQYAFPFTPSQYDDWYPTHKGKAKTPCLVGFCTLPKVQRDFAVMETDEEGTSYLWLSDSHDFCSAVFKPQGYCTYSGTFYLGPFWTPGQMPDGTTYYQVFGLVSGEFVDDSGIVYDNVGAIFNFITYPHPGEQDGSGVVATGSVVVVISAK